MTRALVTQLVEAFTGDFWNSNKRREAQSEAITAALEYLATEPVPKLTETLAQQDIKLSTEFEPIGERAVLIAELRRIAARGMADYANTGYPNSNAIRRAADMLEADAQEMGEYRDHAKTVGDSRFEGWYSELNQSGKGSKQIAREAYEAGLNETNSQQAEPDANSNDA